jgi:competence protein ComEA
MGISVMQTRRARSILAAIVVVVVFVFILAVTRSERSRELVLQIEPIDLSNEVTVYVGGAVSDPGLYSLPRGSRVNEAVDLAGPLDDADLSALSLATVIRDEDSIVIPEQRAQAQDVPQSSSVQSSDHQNNGNPSTIDLNTASQSELQSLPGIGPALAERIMEYRSTQGGFQSVSELSEITGISDRMVEELRPLLEIGG